MHSTSAAMHGPMIMIAAQVGALVGIPGHHGHYTIYVPPPPYESSSIRPQAAPQGCVLLRSAPGPGQQGQAQADMAADTTNLAASPPVVEHKAPAHPHVARYFVIDKGNHRYNCVVNSLRRAGLQEVAQEYANGARGRWSVWWGGYPSERSFKQLRPHQKLNHFPG